MQNKLKLKKFFLRALFFLMFASAVQAQSVYNWGYPGTQAFPGDYMATASDLAVYDPVLAFMFCRLKTTVCLWIFSSIQLARPVRDYDDGDDFVLYDQSNGTGMFILLKEQVLVWDLIGVDRAAPVPMIMMVMA